ncbi:MAG: chitobiase/beta-hexosaminidase C-terminal domain-containing protein [Firmicutes bacterium]|nr:chitobiase/beta-hexosaminidase C-terminal domain-containing protein [Bacillota bacterium]
MKKRTTRCLALLLAVVMVLSVMPVAMAEETAKTATLVTDASTLKDGDEIILVAEANEKIYAAGKMSGKYLSSVETTVPALDSEVEIFKLNGTDGKWTLTGTDGKKISTDAAKALNTTDKGTSTWTISIAENGEATIASTNTEYGRFLYNVNNPRFLNYTSDSNKSMLLPKIYKVEGTTQQQVATPTASPAAGEVAKGTKVEFKCKTEGAKISYKTTGEYTEYTDPVEVNADTTFTVKATKAGMDDSDEVKFAYTVKAEEPVQSLFKDGEQIVIYNPANMKALSTEYTGFYNKGTDVTLTNGTLTGYTEADVWTVGVNADGSYTFSTKDGKKLSMAEKYTSTPLDDVNTAWKVSEAATTGCYYIQNAVRGNYLEWYADKSNWSSYGSIGSNEALFAQAFYRVRKSGIVTSLSEGDTVVVFNPANMKALST